MINQVASSLASLVPFGRLGPRAASPALDDSVATLVIGLGQEGWQAATLLNQMTLSTYSPRAQRRIQYFVIARRQAMSRKGWLPPPQAFLIGIDPIDWAHIPIHFSSAGVDHWWPRRRSTAANVDSNQIRCFGRLLLFRDSVKLHNELTQRTDELIATSARQGERLVILLGSLAEAESSGLLFDVAQLVQLQLREHPTSIVAILTTQTSETDEAARELAKANTYAALKELDAMLVTPGNYRLGISLADRTRKLAELREIRLFDQILIQGGDAAPGEIPPAAALSEMAFSWLQYQNTHLPADLPLPAAKPIGMRRERYDGYTFFNVSKLALPTSAATDIAAVELARKLLFEMRRNAPLHVINGQVAELLERCKKDMAVEDQQTINERLQFFAQRTQPDALNREIRTRRDKQNLSLQQMAETLILELEREDKAEEFLETLPNLPPQRQITLRKRIEVALEAARSELINRLTDWPTTWTCLQGRSLQDTLDVIVELFNQVHTTLNEMRVRSDTAKKDWQEARRVLFGLGKEYDERFSGMKHRLRGQPSKYLDDLFTTFERAAGHAIDYIYLSCNVVAWESLWNAIGVIRDNLRVTLQQIDRTNQEVATYQARVQNALREAAEQPPTRTYAQPLVDMLWFNEGVIAVPTVINASYEKLIPRIYRPWAQDKPAAERNVLYFLRDILPACSRFLIDSVRFTPLQPYMLRQRGQAMLHTVSVVQQAAEPTWMPGPTISPTWNLFEWIRCSENDPSNRVLSLVPETYPWQQREVASPDPDELCLVRLVHGLTIESIKPLVVDYKRAYDRISAEGIPLHLDRRWESRLPELMQTSLQRQASERWERAFQAVRHNPATAQRPLVDLIQFFAQALYVDPSGVRRVPFRANDFVLVVLKLQKLRLRLPPAECPVVFSYSTRPPNELAQDIYDAAMSIGSNHQSFVMIVNVNRQENIDFVADALQGEKFNVVILDEARFKDIVGAQTPMNILNEIILADVDLTKVSPFVPAGPVPENMFFGRDQEIKGIRTTIRTHSVALIGGRRIGKTSILQQVLRLLSIPDSRYKAYYLDCSHVVTYKKFFSSIKSRWKVETHAQDPTDFEEIVNELVGRHSDEQIVFLLDEVDRLIQCDQAQQGPFQELLLRTFRSLSNEERCRFVFSGERLLSLVREDPHSAMFNFAMPVRLELLEKAAVERLITEPFEMMNILFDNAPKLTHNIFEISAGHPSIVQVICERLISVLNKDGSRLITEGHLSKVLAQPELQKDIIMTFWGQMNHLARLITLIWPSDNPILTVDEIHSRASEYLSFRTLSLTEIRDAIGDLDLYHFIRVSGAECTLVVRSFPVLLENMDIRDLEIRTTLEKMRAEHVK